MDDPTSDPELTVVGRKANGLSRGQSARKNSEAQGSYAAPSASETADDHSQPQPKGEVTSPARPVWVRHTVGLQDRTSLRLRDAADAQKKKARHGLLTAGEPQTEQEIADLGIRLALGQLGYD